MYDWKDVARRLERLADPNHMTDHYLTQYVKGDQRCTRRTPKREVNWDQRIANHPREVDYHGEFVTGALRFGYFFGDPTQLIVYDLDDHDYEPGRTRLVEDLSSWFEAQEIYHWVEPTRRGFHLYIPLEEPASQKEISPIARAALEAALPSTKQIEVYPSTKGLFFPVNPLSPVGKNRATLDSLQNLVGCIPTISALPRDSLYIPIKKKTTYSAYAPTRRWEHSWRDTRPFIRRYWGFPELRQDFLGAMNLEPTGETLNQQNGLELLPVATTLQDRTYDSGIYLVTKGSKPDTWFSICNYHASINQGLSLSPQAEIRLENQDSSRGWLIQVPTWLRLHKQDTSKVLPWLWKKYGFVLKSEWDAGELVELIDVYAPEKATSQQILEFCLKQDLMGFNRTDRYGWPNARALGIKLRQFGVPRYRSHGRQYYQLKMFKDLLVTQSKGQLALALSLLDGHPEKIRALVKEMGRQNLVIAQGVIQTP